jgi:predicted small lipoprotein YifL
MMKGAHWIIVAAAVTLAACGQQSQKGPETGPPSEIEDATADEAGALPPLPQVDAALLSAAPADFVAIEPTELGVVGAPTIEEAIAPLVGSPETSEEGASVSLTVREAGETATADVVRSNIPDDSVSAGHVRIEFRREPEGWFPTNAYRRSLCRRGELAGQWTSGLCP